MSSSERDPVKVDSRLLSSYIEDLGRIGRSADGGLYRFQYDTAWRQARDTLVEWISDAGLEPRVDAVGNVFGRLPGQDSRVILTGSHIDTVPSGGKYDGALGVVGGLAALAALRRLGEEPKHTVEVVALCEEESSRFQGNFFGTRALLGLVDPHETQGLVDADGITLGEAMRGADLDPEAVREAARDDIAAFIELHVEQGRILYDEGVDIGLVEAITGLVWETIKVFGRQDHAGGTPMDARRDALQAAAEMALEITRLVEREGRPAVATTGRWRVQPGWPSIVPELTEFSLDLRHPDPSVHDRLLDEAHALCQSIAARRGVRTTIERDKEEAPALLDRGLLNACRCAADACAATWKLMPSGAGHDSQLMATRVPTCMVFVPSVEGLSHTPEEFTSAEDCATGASVLATALHKIAFE